jgi:hypothetical protein
MNDLFVLIVEDKFLLLVKLVEIIVLIVLFPYMLMKRFLEIENLLANELCIR